MDYLFIIMSLCSLDEILENVNCLPKRDIVNGLLESCSVEDLTCMKMEMAEKCKCISDFPKGEFYSRRKPKGASIFSSLEERLADDIFELLKCFDTGYVGPEVKGMFKNLSDDGDDAERSIISESRISLPSPSVRESGWKGIKSQVTSLQSNYLIFCESTKAKISELEAEMDSLKCLVKDQQGEIETLKRENSELRHISQMVERWTSRCSFGGSFRSKSPVKKITDNISGRGSSNDDGDNPQEPGSSHVGKGVSPGARAYSEVLLGSGNGQPTTGDCVGGVLPPEGDNRLQNAAGSQEEGEHWSDAQADVIITGQGCVNVGQNNSPFRKNKGEQGEGVSVNKASDQRSDREADVAVNVGATDGFVGVKRNRVKVKRFFLSGISENVTREIILDYLSKRGVNPTLLSLFDSKWKGTKSAKINVRSEDSGTIMRQNFWPPFVKCRQWLSKARFLQQPSRMKTQEVNDGSNQKSQVNSNLNARKSKTIE